MIAMLTAIRALAPRAVSGPVLTGLIAAGLVAIGGLGFWRGVAALDAREARAVAFAVDARDTHWRAQIAAAEATMQATRAASAEKALATQAQAETEITRLRAALRDQEQTDAGMAGGNHCGLERDRVRLLSGR
jgi:hypothetical protein